MKKLYILIFATVALMSCNKDSLSSKSVITIDDVKETPFDKWLYATYVAPYNINFKYRYEEIEADWNYYTVPADYNNAIKLAHIVKYTCIEAYNEAAGVEFTRSNFPKMIFLIGTWEYQNNGTYILGTAEGGKKILLAGVNFLSQYLGSAKDLNYYYLKTIHHEFDHILNQNKPYPTSFQFITGTEYIGAVWNKAPYNSEDYYLAHGFISDYAQQEHVEDFAEMLSIYITSSKDQWDEWMAAASIYTAEYNDQYGTSLTDGAVLINSKLDVVRDYMADNWDVDLEELRDIIQRRQQDIIEGKIDLDDITVR